MSTNKKLIILSIALLLCITIGGTLAFSTSIEDETNILSTGKVEIKQHEYERKKDASGRYTSELIKFTQGQDIDPAYYVDRQVKYDETSQSWDSIGVNSDNLLYDESVKNVIDKFVFVENTGKTDAYFRTIIAFECPNGFDYSLIHFNINNNSKFQWGDIGYANINGNRYYLKVATYKEVLATGETAIPSLLQVYLDPKTTNQDMDLFGNTFDILVKTQATQSIEGISSKNVLDEVFGDLVDTLPWDGEIIPCIIKNKDELRTLFKNGGNCVLDANLEFDGDLGTSYTSVPSIKKSVVLNTNGYNLITSAKSNINYNMFIPVGENGKLTLNGNGSINLTDEAISLANNSVIYSYSNGEVIINGGSYHSSGAKYNIAIWAEGNSVITINDGNFTNTGDKSSLIFATQNAKIYINGGIFRTSSLEENDLLNTGDHSPNARIIISGGTFINVDPSTPRSDDVGRIIIEDGYKVISETQTNGDVWYMVVPE